MSSPFLFQGHDYPRTGLRQSHRQTTKRNFAISRRRDGYDHAKGNGLADFTSKRRNAPARKVARITQDRDFRDEEERVDSLTRLDIDIEAQSYRIRVGDRDLDKL